MIQPGITRQLQVLDNPLVSADQLEFPVRRALEDEVVSAVVQVIRQMPGSDLYLVTGTRPDGLIARYLLALAPGWSVHRLSLPAI